MRPVPDESVESIETDERLILITHLVEARLISILRQDRYRSCFCAVSSSARQILLNSRKGSSRLATLDCTSSGVRFGSEYVLIMY